MQDVIHDKSKENTQREQKRGKKRQTADRQTET